MAKKWKKKEIEDYISTKQISQENYVAPTVEIGTAPSYKSVASTVDAFNSVQPTIKSVDSTIDDNNKFSFSIDNKKEEPTTGQKLGFVGKSAGAGLTSGLTGIADAPLQNVQEGAQKGKKKGKLENYLQGLARTLDIYGLSTMPETAKEVQQIVQDKNKKGWQKALNIGGAILNNNPLVNNLEAAGQQLNIFDKNAEKDIKKAREIVETPSNKLNESVAKDSEKMGKGWQIAGEVSQTIGNMIPSMALSAVTKNPDIGLAAMGVSAKGQATKEAEERGADLNTANEIGLGKGLVEVGTEKLTGGLKFFGKGTADDLVEKGINKAIKNKAGNFIAKQVAGMAGEVGEETISDLVGTAIDKATVDPDASYSFDDWKKTALMTMLSTGALNTISGGYGRKAYQLNAEELNDIAQSKKVQDTVNERVEQFKTPDMTPEQVEQLREQTTAVVLGEIQQNVDDILDSSITQLQEQPQIPTQTPINTLSSNIQEQNNQILGQEQTPQITPLNQVNQELQETRQQDVADSVRAMNLEQEPKFTQKQGNYVYEKSDNSKIDTFRKDAATYLKAGEQTDNFVKTLEKIIEDKDIEIRFDPNLRDSQGRMANGSYSNNVITLNPNSNRAGEFLAIHELTHAIGTKSMINMIQKYRKSNAEFDSAVKRLLTTYNTTEINEEALGDIAGQLFGNQEYINNLSMENPSLFKKIYNEIKYLWHKFTGYKNQDQFIEDLRNKWESAYRNQKVQQKAKNSNIEMSTQTDSNGSKLSQQQVDYFKDSKVRNENGNLKVMYRGGKENINVFDTNHTATRYTNLGTTYEADVKGFFFTDNIDYAKEFGNTKEYYLNVTNPVTMDNIDDLNKIFKPMLDNMLEEQDIYQWQYDKAVADNTIYRRFIDENGIDWEDIDKPAFNESLNIMKKLGYDGFYTNEGNGEKALFVFNSNQIKNIDNLTPTKSDDIRYSKEELKKEPIKDNTGRELSKGQQEYFKDSKVVDEDGNLKHVYHGTASGEFTIFDKSKGNVEGDFGKGLYFTDNENDVNTNYEDGGPDFENKVDRLAERIEQDEDISYDEAKEKARKQLYKGGYKFDSYLNMENPAVVGETRVFNLDDYNEDIESDLENEARDYQEDIEEYTKDYFGTDDISSLSEDDLKEARDEYFREQGIYDDIVNRYLEDDIENAVASVENELEMYDSSELRNLLWESVYDGGLEVQELKDKINERLEISDYDGNIANNEATRLILESLGYDGIIDNTVSNKFSNMNMDSDTTHYIVFNPNQIKNVDNLNPTKNEDIRYSKNNQTWREYLEKEFPSQGTRTDLQDINERNKPKQENKTTQEEKPQEMPKNEVKQEVKKSYLTSAEQNELDGLKSVENSGFAELTKQEQARMEELEKKSQGITKKFPELKKTVTQEDTKPLYFKYKDSEISRENNKILNEAKKIVESNKQGRRTKEQWLQVAEYIGSNADIKNSTDLQKLAMETWLASRPNTKDNLNRQGKKYVDFKTNEWFNAMYKGAGVGTDVKLSQEERNTINESKQENKTTQEEKPQEMPKNPVADSVKAMNLEKENIKYSAEEKIEKSVRNQYKGLSEDKIQQIIELKEEQKEKDKMYSNFSNKQRAKQRIMINAYETNAKIRKIVQGDSLQKVEGGLTDKELAKAIEKENSNYIGKNVMADGKKATIIGNPYGRVKVEFEDGSIKTFDKDDITTINKPKQDEVVVLRTPTEIQPKEVKTPEQKQEYFEESGTPKKVAKILSETPRETETSTLREKYQTLKRAVVDKGEAIYRIAKQTKNRRLYAMYDRIGLATGEGNSDIGISQTNLDGESYKNFTDSKGNKTSMSLNDIWKDVEDSNIPENVMNEYLANYLNVDRYKANQLSIEEIEELKDLNKYKNLSKTQKERVEELNTLAETRNVFGKDITREDSLNKIKEIEEKYPQIKRPAENIWQYGKNQLQKMVDAGLVSKESQEYYNENTPHYVRLQRSTESKKGSVFDSKGHLQVNNQIKKAKGGTKDIIPFKDSMAQYTLDTTSSIRKNLFGQELSKTLKNGLETDGNVDIDNIDNNILNANEDGSYTFKIFKDGKPEVLTIDKGIYEALQPNKHYELEKLFTPFRAVSNFKRTVLTDKNPLFLATNFFKDFFDAPLNTKHSTVDFVKNYGVAINQILKNGEYYQKYQALGGNQNTYFDKEGFSKPSKISKIVAPIEKANEFIEMLPRMSEFITSLKKGESLDEAMYNAAEITTNFKRGGTATKIVNRNGATFLNASVQGFDKQIRNFTEIQNPKQAVRLMTKALVLGVAPALLNAVMYDDDDEYEDLPDYVKDSYYLFKTGKDNKWIRIPKGRAISVIQAAARRTYNFSKGDKDAYKGLAGHFENQLAPNNPLESNVLSPLVDVKNNKAWSGNKIVSDSIANASHPEEEYDAKTDELSKWLGKKLGKSPKKINYIIDQNTGAIGDLLLPFLTKQAEGEDDSIAGRLLKNPIKDKFSTDAVLNSKQVNQFYDAFNKAEDDKKWSKATDEDKLKYKYLYSTMLELAEKNKQIKEIESSDKSDKEKYRETKAIKQEMNDMSKKAVKESENIKINDYYAQIDDKVYKKEYDKSTGEYKYTKVQQKQLDKIKDKGVPLSDYFQEAYEKQKKRATK